MKPKSGIYIILNLQSGRHYVGSASLMTSRFSAHRSYLRKGRHANCKLQRAWDKYGAESFRFDVVERVADIKLLAEREQFWMDQTLPFYNILRTARSNRGYKMSEATIKKMSESQKIRYANLSDEEKASRAEKQSISMTGRVQSEVTRERRRQAMLGRTFEDESREKMAEYANNRPQEHRDKIGAARAKSYIVTSPDGVRSEITNLSAFCRQMDLSQAHMSAISLGKRNHHRGWKCEPNTADTVHVM